MLQENNESSVSKDIQDTQQLSSDNDKAVKKFIQKKRNLFSLNEYVNGIISGNRIILSQAITLAESSLHEHYNLAQKIIERCIPYSGNSVRIGITGIPGVGKSTFIEAFGKHITGNGKKLAVLAVDPSSEISKGSILGDKTRMSELSNDPNAFIRPSPNTGTLGGVARKTRESIILCEAAGFDTIIVETVGVGQSETSVNIMVDFFLLLMLAGAGDELQGIKRGIMEMADAVVINKADGENILNTEIAKNELKNVLHFFRPSSSGWMPVAETCSAKTNTGIDKIWNLINDYISITKNNGYFFSKRQEQAKIRMFEMISETLTEKFYQNNNVSKFLPEIINELSQQKISSYSAGQKLLDIYFKSIQKNSLKL